MKEICEGISRVFYNLRNTIDTEIIIHLRPNWKVPVINENSTVGEQIKYYRRLASVRQTDLSTRLGCDRGVLDRIENRDIKLIDGVLLKSVLKELNIEEKICINDDYLKFVLKEPIKKIKNFRKNNNYSVSDLASISGIHNAVIGRWEKGEEKITRKSFEKLKKCMNF